MNGQSNGMRIRNQLQAFRRGRGVVKIRNTGFRTAGIALVVSVSLIISCASAITPLEPQVSSVSQKEILFTLMPGENPSDGQGSFGRLLLKTRDVPLLFIYIEDSRFAYTCYDYEKNSYLGGYRVIPRRKIKNSEQVLTRSDIERAYYLGTERKRDEYPSQWIYAEWEGGAGFFEAERFFETIGKDPFTAIFDKR